MERVVGSVVIADPYRPGISPHTETAFLVLPPRAGGTRYATGIVRPPRPRHWRGPHVMITTPRPTRQVVPTLTREGVRRQFRARQPVGPTPEPIGLQHPTTIVKNRYRWSLGGP